MEGYICNFKNFSPNYKIIMLCLRGSPGEFRRGPGTLDYVEGYW